MTAISEVFKVQQMYDADRLAMESDIPGEMLMENAGAAIAAHITAHWDPCPILILCGPGNNGGDGYVIARHLFEADWSVTVACFGDPAQLKGDAAVMFKRCPVSAVPIAEISIPNEGMVVDALFGAGFKGSLPLELQTLFQQLEQQGLDVVAVDVPSGVDGNTGQISAGTPDAHFTVTFFRPKIGHLFYPARAKCGKLQVVDIGIPDTVLSHIDCKTYLNEPEFWEEALPVFDLSGHKYNRGHAAVVGGGISSTGAARISARNTLRMGAGAVTVIAPPAALSTYATVLEAVMVKSIADEVAFKEFLNAKRIGAVLVGPGNGVGTRTRDFTLAALASGAHVVLDADALTVFQEDPEVLFAAIGANLERQVVLTPHEAEFARLFKGEGTALTRCREAARVSGATVILKGATTVVANPEGYATLNTNAPPWLATAGSGDALAGLVTALILNGGAPLKCASAAVWIHGEAATQFGPGLIAEDIEMEIPEILRKFY